MAKLKCFDNVKIPGLKEKFEGRIKDDMTIEQEREIATDIAIEYHKELHDELNGLKKRMGLKPDPYTPSVRQAGTEITSSTKNTQNDNQEKSRTEESGQKSTTKGKDTTKEESSEAGRTGGTTAGTTEATGVPDTSTRSVNRGVGPGTELQPESTTEGDIDRSNDAQSGNKPGRSGEARLEPNDFTNVFDKVLAYFASGGKINVSAITELFGGKDSRIRQNASVENEKRSRIGLLSKDAPGIDGLAHQLFEGTIDAQGNSQYSTEEFKDAIEQAISQFTSGPQMADDLTTRYADEADVLGQLSPLEADMIRAGEIAAIRRQIDAMPEDVLNELFAFLGQFQNQYGLLDWNAISEATRGFNPEFLELSDNAKQQLENAIANVEKEEQRSDADSENAGSAPPQQKSISEKGKDLADRLRQLKTKPDILQANIFGIPIAIYDGAIETIATAIERGAQLVEAIQFGIRYIRDNGGGDDFQQDAFEKHINDFVEGKKPVIKTTGETRTTVDETLPFTGPIPTRFDERRFSQQVLDKPGIVKPTKRAVEKNLKYAIQTNALTVQEANEIIDKIGNDEAYDLVVNNGDVKPAVRVVLGQILILRYNNMAARETDRVERNRLIDKTISIANFVSERLGTESGQMIQAFSLFQRLSPEGQVRAAAKEIKEVSEKKKERRQADVKAITDKLQQANEDTVKELEKSEKVKAKVQKAENATIKKAKDKIEAAKKRRENIIKKYKGDKGKNLFSTVPGLTPEGIEFVGNLAKTYLDEGLANVEIIAAKIFDHLKEIAGKDVADDVRLDVGNIIQQQYEANANKAIATNFKKLETEIGKIVREHYTVPEETKRTLKQKFVDSIALAPEDAAELAIEIESEFDRIATRKKNDILLNEKKRFDRVHKNLSGAKKVVKRDLQDEMIRYSNLGALTNEQMMEVISEKLGLGALSPEEAREIEKLANAIQKAPEGSPKSDATQALLTYRANLKGTSWGEVAQAVWYANILSGYGTQIINLVSTFVNGFSIAAVETARDPRSLPVLAIGTAKGLKRGISEAWHTLSTGKTPIHISKIETPDVLERTKFLGGYLNPYNYLKFVARLMKASDVLAFQGLKEMRATQLAYREAKKQGLSNPFSSKVWEAVNETLLNTKDRYDEALAQAKSEGATGKDLKRRTYELMELSRPIQVTEDAYGFAAKGTFNHPPEGTLGALTNLISVPLDLQVGGVRPLRFIVPFTRIITNVANNAIDFTPLGFVRALRNQRGASSFLKNPYTKETYYKMTPEERAQTYTKASLGIGLTMVLYALTKIEGDDGEPIVEITGGGTGDYKKDAQLRQSGWQPYSIKIGGKYYSYKLTPLVFNLSWIGDWDDHEKYDKDADEETFLKKFTLTSVLRAKMLSDMTWIGSTGNLMNALNEGNVDAMAKGVENEVKSAAKGFILPNAYSQIAQKTQQIFNMPQKQVDGLWEELVQDIPIARNKLNDKINALGDPIVRDRDLLVSQETTDPNWKFLLDKKGWVAPINKNTLVVLDKKTNDERLANEDEYYEFSKVRGAKIKAAIEDIRSNGAFTMENEKGETEVTTREDVATGRKAAADLTTRELQKLLRTISGKATKETHKQLFSNEEE